MEEKEIICLVCKEECSRNLSDVESVCFSCVTKIVEDYLDYHEDDEVEDVDCLECGKLKPLCACVISEAGK